MMIRLIDMFISFFGLIFLFPVFILVTILGFMDTGSPIFVQVRVGKQKVPFKLLKFRTMSRDTKSVASHLANNSSITKFGSFLRKTKLDELPQLVNVLKGDMSLVGPRPNLFNQHDLILERENLDIYSVLPGVTGLAQIQNIDMSEPKRLAETDREMLDVLSLRSYFYFIFKTIVGSGQGDAIR